MGTSIVAAKAFIYNQTVSVVGLEYQVFVFYVHYIFHRHGMYILQTNIVSLHFKKHQEQNLIFDIP